MDARMGKAKGKGQIGSKCRSQTGYGMLVAAILKKVMTRRWGLD